MRRNPVLPGLVIVLTIGFMPCLPWQRLPRLIYGEGIPLASLTVEENTTVT